MQSKRSLRIPRVLCHELPSLQKPVAVDAEEAAHLKQVLRLSDGSPVIALDGRGHAIPGQYFLQDKKPFIRTSEKVASESRAPKDEQGSLVLEVSVIKGDAMSWVIEKAVELGARRVVPVISDHAVVQVDKKGTEHFIERWQRIADQALKQCERLNRLIVEAPRSTEELLRMPLSAGAIRAVAVEPKAHEDWGVAVEPLSSRFFRGNEDRNVLIGPEGGWSAHEIDLFRIEAREKRLRAADLGPLVLRAETAALFTLSCALSSRLAID
jgi:16S rRNA (uracil1498-N3)-methyltransferase